MKVKTMLKVPKDIEKIFLRRFLYIKCNKFQERGSGILNNTWKSTIKSTISETLHYFLAAVIGVVKFAFDKIYHAISHYMTAKSTA